MRRNYLAKTALALGLVLPLGADSYAQTVTTFSYTGAVQTYIVPPGVTEINIEAWGGQGEDVTELYDPQTGGLGGYATGNLSVTPGETLYIYVGGQGTDGAGGFNGGGTGGLSTAGGGGTGGYAGSGGGASDVRQGGMDLADRVIVAGGGGGAGRDYVNGSCVPCGTGGNGGAGGGTTGTDGDDPNWSGLLGTFPNPGAGGEGGTPTTGGAGGAGTEGTPGGAGVLGIGGDGVPGSQDVASGGGGGGYYGGGAGGGANGGSGAAAGGGAGGSSYTGSLAMASTTAGVKVGEGEIIITELCIGLDISVSSDSICNGEEVTLSATSTEGGTVTWDGGVINGEAFTPTATTTYTATSDDPGDCAFEVEIVVFDLPTVDAGMDQDVCAGDSTMVSASGTATDWSWDGGITDGVNFMPSAGTTTYTVTGTIDSTGCMATDEVDITVIEVDNSISIIPGSLVSNQDGATYQWLECPDLTPVAGATDQEFTPTADGDYAVAVDLGGCMDTSACQLVHVGFDESELGFGLYPNPANDVVTVQYDQPYTYAIINQLGEVVLSGNAVGTTLIDLTTLANGAYVVRLTSDDKTGSTQLIKQ